MSLNKLNQYVSNNNKTVWVVSCLAFGVTLYVSKILEKDNEENGLNWLINLDSVAKIESSWNCNDESTYLYHIKQSHITTSLDKKFYKINNQIQSEIYSIVNYMIDNELDTIGLEWLWEYKWKYNKDQKEEFRLFMLDTFWNNVKTLQEIMDTLIQNGMKIKTLNKTDEKLWFMKQQNLLMQKYKQEYKILVEKYPYIYWWAVKSIVESWWKVNVVPTSNPKLNNLQNKKNKNKSVDYNRKIWLIVMELRENYIIHSIISETQEWW